MGEPEPLDLELLQRGDDDEIRRAVRELDLFSLAQGVVYNVIGSTYEADVRWVANESLQVLLPRAIHTCRTIDNVRPMLRTIAGRRAIIFVNVAFRRWEREFGEELEGLELRGIPEPHAAPEVNPVTVLGDILAEGLGMEAYQLAPFVDRLLEEAGLDEVEKHLLIEHMLQGCTQQEFSDRHGIPLSRIGRIKDRLIGKIRRWLTGELIGESRAEFLQRLQRNKEIEETGSRH